MSDDENILEPTEDQTPLIQQEEPGQTGEHKEVPKDQINAGHDTNEPRADSPETLDQDL